MAECRKLCEGGWIVVIFRTTGGKINGSAGEFDRVDREAVSGDDKKDIAKWLSLCRDEVGNYVARVGFIMEAAGGLS